MQGDIGAILEVVMRAKRLVEKRLLNSVGVNISLRRNGCIYVKLSAMN